MNDLIFHYWGKARPTENNPLTYHPLPYHCLDVAAVGEVYLTQHQNLLNFFCRKTGAPPELILAWMRLLLLLHDLGKFSESFQNLRPDLLGKLQNIFSSDKGYSIRHDTLGYWAWEILGAETLEQCQLLAMPNGVGDWSWENEIWPSWMRSVTGHHGIPPEEMENETKFKLAFSEQDEQAVKKYLQAIFPLLESSFPEWKAAKNFNKNAPRLSWWFAGIAVLADWIGSNADYFPYCVPDKNLSDYWEYANKQAEKAVSESGILPVNSDKLRTFRELFPHLEGNPARPLQRLATQVEIAKTPQLFILEDLTGSGKTEAALMLTHRLMARGQVSGLYYGLPTMATANAMYGRVGKCYDKFFEQGTFPSLILAHGARNLSKQFRQSVFEAGKADKDYDDEDSSATARCRSWLADNRKKALLAQVGVGTIDQALLSILYSKHQSLRLLGLFGKVLIVDEVHAHDDYMHSLLKNLLNFHAAGGGSAILLSATLPQKMRQELVDAFAQGSGQLKTICHSAEYPLLTHVCRSKFKEIPVEKNSTTRQVNVRYMEDMNLVISFLLETAQSGHCACWIRNTVKDAREGLQQIRNALAENALLPENANLFHARFAMGDRLKIENQVLANFDEQSGDNRKGKILIATQVVEQSLDLDFDEMVTDLVPMDSLIQRSGRLQRHLRNANGQRIESGTDGRGTPTLHIHGPPPDNEIEKDWYSSFFPGASFVYPDHAQLWRTAKILLEKNEFVLPQDSRELIEKVFGENKIEAPDTLLSASLKVEGKNKAKVQTGFYNSLNLDDYYSRSGFDWWADSIAPTRLGEPCSTLKLAKWDGKTLCPWCNDDSENTFAENWALSQVQVSQKYADKTAEPGDAELTRQIKQLEEQLSDRGKWSVILPLVFNGKNWSGEVLDKAENLRRFIYDPELGLLREDESV